LLLYFFFRQIHFIQGPNHLHIQVFV